MKWIERAGRTVVLVGLTMFIQWMWEMPKWSFPLVIAALDLEWQLKDYAAKSGDE